MELALTRDVFSCPQVNVFVPDNTHFPKMMIDLHCSGPDLLILVLRAVISQLLLDGA